MSIAIRDELHELIDKLPEGELVTARRFLRYLHLTSDDPVLRAFTDAPLDDEPLTPEQEAKLQEAEEAIARGDVVHREELRRDRKS